MVISAQLRLGGFYGWAVGRLGRLDLSPPALLGALIAVAAGLSAVFSNDIVCLAMAPVLVEVCLDRRLDPIPFLLGLACAANAGSAATLIGNPQNMLIGETLALSFSDYLRVAALPVTLGLMRHLGHRRGSHPRTLATPHATARTAGRRRAPPNTGPRSTVGRASRG